MSAYEFTIQIIGMKGTGKTSLVHRYCNSQYVRSEVPALTQITESMQYNSQPFEVTTKFEIFEQTPTELKDYQIIAVDLRQEQKVIDDQIARLSRQLSFKTSQVIPVIGLCRDKQASTIDKIAFPHAEVSAFNGQGVKSFFGTIIWNLVQKQVLQLEEEQSFQSLNFSVEQYTNKTKFESENYMEFLQKFNLAEFFRDLVLDICDNKPADVLEYCRDQCLRK